MHDILVRYYLDPKHITVYSGRWDVWLVQHQHWPIYNRLLLMTDTQLNRVLNNAQEEAENIRNSPLWKALS